MRVAAVQYQPPRGRPDFARNALAELVDSALGQGARLVVCPELSAIPYVWRDAAELAPYAERPRGPTFQALAPLARVASATVVAGIAEAGADGLYNSAIVIGPDGELVGTYRKVLLFDLDRTWARPGTRRPVYSVDGTRVLPGICMDMNDDRFVEHVRATPDAVVAFLTNWLDEGISPIPYWQMRLLGVRAPLVAANTWGVDRGIPFRGESAILGADGRELARAPCSGDAVIVADLRNWPD